MSYIKITEVQKEIPTEILKEILKEILILKGVPEEILKIWHKFQAES